MGPNMGPNMKDSLGLRVGNMKIRRGVGRHKNVSKKNGWKNGVEFEETRVV